MPTTIAPPSATQHVRSGPLTLRRAGNGHLVLINVDQYHAMIEHGILPEGAPIELLEGMLWYKDRSSREDPLMSIGPRHSGGVKRIERLEPALEAIGFAVRAQQPIALLPVDEPEPDGLIARGPFTRYDARHPDASDICVAIEVSDSSLRHDRTIKLRIYATADIPQYVIVDLIHDVIEVRADPDPIAGSYGTTTIVARDGTVTFHLFDGQTLAVPAADLLP